MLAAVTTSIADSHITQTIETKRPLGLSTAVDNIVCNYFSIFS
jgi:hypothetical protein